MFLTQPHPSAPLDFLHSLSVTLLSLLIYFFHPRLCCPLCFKHLFVWLPPPPSPPSLPSPPPPPCLSFPSHPQMFFLCLSSI